MKLFSKNFLLSVVLFFTTFFTTVRSQSVANINDIMFQTFGWDVHQQKIVSDEGGLYSYLNNRSCALANAGFNVLWLPPPSKSTGGTGYIPTELFNFSSTSFGTEAQLKALLTSLNTSSPRIHPMADIVVNHRGGTTNWMDFTNPTWDCKSVVSNDEAAGPLNTSGIKPCGTTDTGEGFNAGRDLDHTNIQVQNGVKEYLSRLKGLGFDSWRWDVAKGFAASYFGDYIAASSPYSSVGEYWDGNKNTLKSWVDGTGGKSAAFDFDLYYDLIEAVNNGNYSRLGGGPGLAGIFGYADKTVTFVDNHDTFVKGSIITSENIMKGYAYILTHPGVPCVFFPHYYGGKYTKDENNNPVSITYTSNETPINKLMAIRKASGINAYSSVVVSNAGSFYSAIISNNGIDKVAVKIGPGSWDPGAGWVLNTFGTDYAVWSKAAINFAPTVSISPIGGSFVSGTTKSVTLTATDDKSGSTIYYTTDGSAPTASSTIYSAPVNVSSTTTVKAIVRDSEGLFSCVASQTYTFLTVGDITVKFKPASNWGTTAYVYHWNALPSANLSDATWPGKPMTGPDVNGYYSYTLPNIAISNIIFTKGSSGPQTINLLGVSKNTCYIATGNVSNIDVTETDCTTLGVGEIANEFTRLKLYPNPTTGTFKVNKAISNLSIIDVTGKVVKQFNGTFQSDASYDISTLVRGMYFVKLKTTSGTETTLKLSKD